MLKLHTREQGGNAAINLTPLIDMVFILLVFFAVNSTFVKFPGVDINRPAAETAVADPTTNVLVAVTETGDIWVDKQRVDVRRLRSVIERELIENPNAAVVILSDKNSRTGIVIEVVDQARLAGAAKVAVAAAEPTES